MRLSDLRQAMAFELSRINGLSVSAYRPGVIEPPHAIVNIVSGQFDSTMGRGSDLITAQVVVLVARADDSDSLAILDEYVAGHGQRSIKTALERASGDGLSYVRVNNYDITTSGTPDGAEYLAATFEVDAVISGT